MRKRIFYYQMDKRLLVLLIFYLSIWNVSLASAQVQDGFTCKAPDRVSAGLNHIEPMKVVCNGKEIISSSRQMLVEPDAEHEYATGVVRSFLEVNGIDSDTCRISYIYDSSEFRIASSESSRYFVVTVDQACGLDDPILAYSLEYGFHDAEP